MISMRFEILMINDAHFFHTEACVAMEDEEPQILTRWAVP